jgi:Malectin domain/Ricin-type beta-trefoil lectin domain-like/Right handed beta helix region
MTRSMQPLGIGLALLTALTVANPLLAQEQAISPSLLQIDAGGAAVGTWMADQGFTASATASTTAPIVTTLVANPAPQPVYQSERSGSFTYTLAKLAAGVVYPIDLHFAEIEWTKPGQREFNVLINGTQVLTNFDIVAESGGEDIALVRSFPATASSTGTITIQFTPGGADVPKVSGIEVHMPTQAAPVVPSGNVFTLQSVSSGMNLDDNNTTSAGTRVTQWGPATGNTNQQWLVNRLASGTYNLISLSNGLALDAAGATTAGSVVAQSVPSATSTSQQWIVTSTGANSYQLANVATSFVLDASTGGEGNPIVQNAPAGTASQQWQLAPVQIGAKTPYTTYEAEAGTLGNGAAVVALNGPPADMFATPQLEASGHAFVHLSAAGQSVSWTNTTGASMTAINVRYSIPDAAAGGGITSTIDLYVNGTLRQALPVSSKQTWEYESASQYDSGSKDPSTGTPHHFWDEVHAFVSGAAIEPGDKVTLQMDSTNTASYYNIDLMELEAPPAPLAQPANSLSIVTYGAVANNVSIDSTTAIKNCIADAQTKGMSVWIPQGTFYINTAANIAPTGITMEGAGMWYSKLYFNPPAPYTGHGNVLNPFSSTLRNFAIDASAVSADQDAYGINGKGSNWLVDSVWLEHVGPAMWMDGSDGMVSNNRIDTVYADGINLNNGSGDPGNTGGTNLTAVNNHVRGTGDDGIAINDGMTNPDTGQSIPDMVNTVVIQNTVVAPWWANNIGVYGGRGDYVVNNLITDSVKENGIGIGNFGSDGGTLTTAFIQGNIVERGGSFGYGFQYPAVEIGGSDVAARVNNVMLQGNLLVNPMFSGILINNTENSMIDGNTVDSPLLNGVTINSSASGNATVEGNTVLNLRSGETAFALTAPSFQVSASNNVNKQE